MGAMTLAGDIDRNGDPLGKLLAVHKTTVRPYWTLLLISFLALGMGLMLSVVPRRSGDSGAAAFIPFLVAAIMAAIPVAIVLNALKNEAKIYENGNVYSNRRSVRTVLWEDVECVNESIFVVRINGVPTPSQMFYSIRSKNGDVLKFPARLENIAQLGIRLKSGAVRRGIPVNNNG